MIFFWICLLAPLAVYALPGFNSTFEEDLIVTFSAVYLLLRAANPFRRVFPQWFDVSLSSIFLVVLYLVGWMGLWRGYGLLSGWSLLLYPIGLMVAYWLQRPSNNENAGRPYSHLSAWIAAAWIVILIAAVSVWAPLPVIPSIGDGYYAAAMMGIAVTGTVIAIASQHPWLMSQKKLSGLLIGYAFAALMLGVSNYQLWRVWYEAGEASRAWAPYPFREEEKIQAAFKAPYWAFWNYRRLIDKVELKGNIPKRMLWNQKFGSQIDTQIFRTTDIKLVNVLLHSDTASGPNTLISKYANDTFYQRYVNLPPNQEACQRLFLDAEYNPKDHHIYLLDCWGGVHQYDDGRIELVWRPDPLVEDGIDLEILDGIFYLLRSNRTLITSEPIIWNGGELAPFMFGGDVVDFELFKNTDGALLVSSKGEIASIGQTPPDFPSWGELYFQDDVVVDFEFDLDERGYYLLDAYGAVHGNHADGQTALAYRSPPIADGLAPYWPGIRMAVDLEVDALGRGLNIYTREGELYAIAQTPYRKTFRPSTKYEQRGVALFRGEGTDLYALESNGRIIKLPPDAQ